MDTNQINILICDDDKADVKLFKNYLSKISGKNYYISEAHNESQIENFINSNESFHLIFLDYSMPGKNGLEWLQEIVEKQIAPVIMLTGVGDEETAVEAMKIGAIDYIPKDKLNKYELEKTINNAIERWSLEQERNTLLGIAAHELRNPITTIMGYTQILSSYGNIEKEKVKEIYETINERSEHLLAIINRLLDISRIEKGSVKLEKIEMDFVDFIKGKVKHFLLRAESKKIAIEFSTSLDSLEFLFDPVRFDEVVSNLLDNAIKYSPENSKVLVDVSKQDGNIILSVADNGQGIKSEELKYLFDLFSNVKISSKPTGGESSTGLGLAIVKKIVKLHDGDISVESEVEKGTKFIISLPVKNKKLSRTTH